MVGTAKLWSDGVKQEKNLTLSVYIYTCVVLKHSGTYLELQFIWRF